jgi:pimeloyl-ACP methyl ester carboxylesterase
VRLPHPASIVLATCLALLAVASSALAQDGSPAGLRPVEDPLFGVSSVVPQDWQDLGGGTYARSTSPEDLALVVIQSAQATPDQLWPALLPRFAIDQVPEVTGTLETEHFDWTLYQFNVTLGELAISVELALAEDGGSTHLVLLQSDPDEFAVLHEQVFVPAVDAFDVLAPEPTPDPATLGYAVEEVTFPGGSTDVELAGTLTVPPGPGPHPAVVLMTGSWAQDRDESMRPVTTLKPFALLADALTSAGVAVLRYDDRGVGGSSGDYAAATVDDLAGDGRAALEYLRGRAEIDPARIGLLGHSEGGLYAAQLAAADPDIAFVVGMAAPAVDGVDLIVAQNDAILRSQGVPDEQIARARAAAETSMPAARDGDEAALEASLRDYFGQLWDGSTTDDRTIIGDREVFIERQVEGLMERYLSDWFRSFLAHDPAPDWQQVVAPVLGLFGAKDVQVVSEQNEPALRAALEAGGNQDVEIVVFPDANHLFQAAHSGAMEEYSTLAAEFTADFLPTVVAWVSQQAGVAG